MQPIVIKKVSIGTGRPKTVIPIVERTAEHILMQAKKLANSSAEMIEWRVDYFEEVKQLDTVVLLLATLGELFSHKPFLVTLRTQNEGGQCALPETYFRQLYQAILETKACDLVDVEWSAEVTWRNHLIKQAQQKQIKVLISAHDLQQTPSQNELLARLKQMQQTPADLCKLAVTPREPQDVLTVLQASLQMKAHVADRPFALLAMTPLGLLTRVTGEIFGSAFTFGYLDAASASGQLPLADLEKLLQLFSGVEKVGE